MKAHRKVKFTRIQAQFSDLFGLNRTMAWCIIALIVVVFILAMYWFFHLAPPKTITMTSGPEGSIYQRQAAKYQAILARNGVKLKIVPSQGSLENLKRLADPSVRVDIGFVQGGIATDTKIDALVSLGSLYSSPILIFYRSKVPVELLSQFAGKRLSIGPDGSGLHVLARTLLAANGIEPGGTTVLLDTDADDAEKDLLSGKIDAVFMMGETASPDIIRALLRAPGVRLFNFTQADAYVRRKVFFNKLNLPRGAMDFGKDIPPHDVSLIGPTIELVARDGLHPALSDLLLEAAHEVHGNAGLYRRQGEFPAPLEHEYRLSPDALRFYKSGKSYLYRSLPFWVASTINRILVVFVPVIVVMIPLVKSIPAIYRWKIRLVIYRWYRMLLALERDILRAEPEQQQDLLQRLDEIEQAVNKMKVPASFADQFYVLRGHIGFVRSRLKTEQP
ncbi:MAG TPA: TAXI family TRAP transporter solute-binding subunit [Nitrospirota bacterium]|nr:TAXI family TRAP transporter solute-binding subunit [Nitrospirota bacterium]